MMPSVRSATPSVSCYTLAQVLGRGGSATVYRASSRELRRSVALKLLHPGMAVHRAARQRLAKEAAIARGIGSRRVPMVFDTQSARDTSFIAMEQLRGVTLRQHLARCGRLDLKHTIEVIVGLCRAVEDVHRAGYVHGDIKPDNLVLTGEGVRLIDFGAAAERGAAPAAFGTPRYMGPDRFRSTRLQPSHDLWSVAVVAFECLTGVAAFSGSLPAQVAAQVQYGARIAPTALVPATIPADLDRWFTRATSRDPRQRFATARELSDALVEASGVSELQLAHA